jgi:hypothetical protein
MTHAEDRLYCVHKDARLFRWKVGSGGQIQVKPREGREAVENSDMLPSYLRSVVDAAAAL